MATRILTSATPEELAEQFPYTVRPFTVWYNDDPGCNSRKWVVNDESGEATQEFEDMATAHKVASELGQEWETEVRKQAQALTKVTESELVTLSHQLHGVAAKLAGVDPILRRIVDTLDLGRNSLDVAHALALVGGMSEYLNEEICKIADRVSTLGEKSEAAHA